MEHFMKLKLVRMHKIEASTPDVFAWDSYTVSYRCIILWNSKRIRSELAFNPLYTRPVPINHFKWKGMESLYTYLSQEAQQYYTTLFRSTEVLPPRDNEPDFTIMDSDNSSSDDEL